MYDIMKIMSLTYPIQCVDKGSILPNWNVGNVFTCLFSFLSVSIIQELNTLKVNCVLGIEQ